MAIATATPYSIELHLGQVEHLTVDDVPLKLEITKLSMWDATFTVTGPGVRNPTQPRTMPVLALATWLELARKQQCQTYDHQWEESYYGHKCARCGELVPFGCESWARKEGRGA